MTTQLKPWHDTPVCGRVTTTPIVGGMAVKPCGGPLLPRRAADWNHRASPEDGLVCCSCGEGVVGTDAEVEQAERAQQAWEAEERRCQADVPSSSANGEDEGGTWP